MSNLISELIVSRALWLVPFSIRDRIKAIPGLASLQRAIVSQMLDGREFEHCVDAGPAQGITFRVKMPEDKGIWTGTYEVDFATQLAASVRPGAIAYDIGGWHGFFAGVMAGQGASHVHVFEPLPANAVRIRELVALNPERKITLHPVAVGGSESEMDLLMMPETSMAKLEASTFQPSATATERVRVKVRSIDAMIENGEIAPPDLLKIDVEGAELLVLKGAEATLCRYKPIIFAEVHSSDLLVECQGFLEAIGYRVTMLDDDPAGALSRDVFQIKAKQCTSV